MNGAIQQRKADLLTEAAKTEIDAWLKKYPDDRKQSAVLCALQAAQHQNGGWVTRELMDAIADYLELPPVLVYEVGSRT